METQFSKKNQLLLDSFRLFEQARAKYFDYILAITEGAGFPDQYEDFANAADKIWNPVREDIQDRINSALYDWANAEEERKEI